MNFEPDGWSLWICAGLVLAVFVYEVRRGSWRGWWRK